VYDLIALAVYFLALMCIGRPASYINKWAIKELQNQQHRLENINNNHFLADIQRNESEYASVNSRIYQSKVFIFSTYFMFALLLSHLIYKIIFVGAEFLIIPFFLILVLLIIIKTRKINKELKP